LHSNSWCLLAGTQAALTADHVPLLQDEIRELPGCTTKVSSQLVLQVLPARVSLHTYGFAFISVVGTLPVQSAAIQQKQSFELSTLQTPYLKIMFSESEH
jgi:hypothetical protein